MSLKMFAMFMVYAIGGGLILGASLRNLFDVVISLLVAAWDVCQAIRYRIQAALQR